jgi:tetratricopeptide (TPR) repeat protein
MNLNKIVLFIIKVAFLTNATFCYAQSNEIKKIEVLIENQDFEKALTVSKQINVKKISAAENAKFNYLLANIHVQENNDVAAYNHFIIAKNQYKKLDSIDKVAKINISIISLLLAINKNHIDYNPFLDEYIEYAKKKNNPEFLAKSYKEIAKSFYDSLPETALVYFNKAKVEILKTDNELFHARILQNIGVTYAHQKINKLDSALLLYKSALAIFVKHNSSQDIFTINVNKGVVYNKKKQYNEAIKYFKKADSIPIKEYVKKNKEILYGYMGEAYENNGNFKKALEYFNKQKVYNDVLDENEQIKAVKEIDAKYKTKETLKENTTLKSRVATSRTVIISLTIILTIIILLYKNISKKKKIIEQEKLLETQILETKLKEQELHEIDIMLESQEKERQRIANELHDNLGSLLATIKLNFQNLKNSGSQEDHIFTKTDSLLDEAYQEVRNIAHLKNLGIVGSQGLEQAVRNMAEKMSVVEKLKINVIPFGLSERLQSQTRLRYFE